MDKKSQFAAVFLGMVLVMGTVFTVPFGIGESDEAIDTDTDKDIVLVSLEGEDDVTSIESVGGEILERYPNKALVELPEDEIDSTGIRVENTLPARTEVSVSGYQFDINDGDPDLPEDMTIEEYEEGVEGQYIVHMMGPVASNWRETLEDEGVEIINYIPNYAYQVAMTPEQAERVEDKPFVDWIGIYHPAYRISSEAEPGQVTVRLRPGAEMDKEDLMDFEDKLEMTGLEDLRGDGYRLTGEVQTEEALKDIARMNDVYYISPYVEPELEGEMDIQQVGGGAWFMDDEYETREDLDPTPREGDPQEPYRKHGDYGAYINQLGYSGEGVTVAVADTGLGDGTTPDAGVEDFTGRVIGGHSFGEDDYEGWEDNHMHGTGCAGLIIGDTHRGTGHTWDEYEQGSMPYYMGQGLAYESEVFGIKIFTADGGWLPDAHFDIIEIAANSTDSYIHSNSWGSDSEGSYIGSDEDFDKAVRDADRETEENVPMVITTGAGNEGDDDQTLGSPGNAKNVITIGGNQPYNPDLGYDNPENMYGMSSRGWSEDNRVKPDLVAPAEGIITQNTPMERGGYVTTQGTSFANPIVAGAATIVVDWYEDNYGERPSPAMVKSILINTANGLDSDVGNTRGPVPNEDEGWGVPDLSKLEYPMDDPIGWDFEDQDTLLETGEVEEHRVVVEDEDEALKIALTWTDENALDGDSDGGAPTLKNNLDLEVETPDGEVIRGNAFDVLGGGRSYDGFTYPDAEVMDVFDHSGDGWDDVNNVQNVFIHPDEVDRGEYTISIHGTNVPADANNDGDANQDYALSVYNAAGAPSIELERPVGGEYWETGEEEEIVWDTIEAVGNITEVDLEYSTDGGESWEYIEEGLDDTGSYEWEVVDELTDEAMIRATVYDDLTEEGTDTSGEFAITDITPPEVTLTSPIGGEEWHAGDEENITWETEEGDELIENVTLEYSVDGGNSWELIENETEDVGEYLWEIPDETTSRALVRIWVFCENDTADFDISDDRFDIVGYYPDPPGDIDVSHDGDDNVVTWRNSPGDWPDEMMESDTRSEAGLERDDVEAIDSEAYSDVQVEGRDASAGASSGIESSSEAEYSAPQGDDIMANQPVEHEDGWHSLYGHTISEENDVEWRYEEMGALGMVEPGTWYSGMLLDLSGHVGEITDVAFCDNPETPAAESVVGHVGIDEDGAPAEPFLTSSEEYEGGEEGWIELELDEPVEIDPNEDYWIVMELEDPGDEHFPQGMIYYEHSEPVDNKVPDSGYFTGIDMDPHDPDNWDDTTLRPEPEYGAFTLEARIHTPPTDIFEVEIVDYDQKVDPGENVSVSYTVNNTGEKEGTQDIEFKVDGYVEDRVKDVNLEPGQVYEGNFTWQTDEEDIGPFYVEVASEDLSDGVVVMVDDPKEVAHYTIYRADEKGGPWDDPIDVVNADGSTEYEYVDEGQAGEPFDWYVVRAVSVDGLEEENEDAAVEPGLKPEIEVKRPFGGDYWEAGVDEEIRWDTIEGVGNITEVDLEYSIDGGENWEYIEEGYDDTGTYEWEVVDELTDEAMIRLTVYDDEDWNNTDTSDEFTITDVTPPEIDLTYPVGGEEWKAGTEEEITWETEEGDDSIDYVDIWYREEPGEEWEEVATDLEDTGSYTWEIPDRHTSEAQIRARVIDEERRWSQDTSDEFDVIGIPPEPPEDLEAAHSKVIGADWHRVYPGPRRPFPDTGIGYQEDDPPTWWGGMGTNLPDGVVTDIAYFDYQRADYVIGELRADDDGKPGEVIGETEEYGGRGAGWVELPLIEPVEIEEGDYFVTLEVGDAGMGAYPLGAIEPYVDDAGWVREEGDEWATMPDEWDLDYSWAIEVHTEEHGEGGANNLIEWKQSPGELDDDISHYNLYRAESEDGPWNETTHVESIEADGSEVYEYIDEDKGMADDIFWWYVVRAVATTGREEENTDAVQEPIPPLPASDPEPEDGARGMPIDPELSAYVEHREDEVGEDVELDVSFYDASDDTLIDTVEGVESGSRVSVEWTDRAFYREYSWYVVTDDRKENITSETWSFETREPDPPEIELTRPTGGETWVPGEEEITWEATAGDGELTRIELEYSRDGGRMWNDIVTLTEHDAVYDGGYTWTVPEQFTDQAMIRATAREEIDGLVERDTDTSETFSIREAPSLDVSIEGEGTVDIEPEEIEYEPDAEVDLTAVPDDGWYFVEWTGDYEGTEEEITITMDEDKEITAHFEEYVDLDIDVEGEGSVEVDPDEDRYEQGAEVDLTAVPDDGWYFAEWTDDYEGTEENITITMDEDKEITAHFEEYYELNVVIEGEGSVEVDPDEDRYEEGTEVDLTAVPDDGWYFVEWTGDYIGMEENITITMDEDKEITVVFEEDVEYYELTVEVEGEGSVEVDPDQDEYENGTVVTLEAVPDDDWEFDDWDGTDETGEEIEITMDEDKEITAHFEEEDEIGMAMIIGVIVIIVIILAIIGYMVMKGGKETETEIEEEMTMEEEFGEEEFGEEEEMFEETEEEDLEQDLFEEEAGEEEFGEEEFGEEEEMFEETEESGEEDFFEEEEEL